MAPWRKRMLLMCKRKSTTGDEFHQTSYTFSRAQTLSNAYSLPPRCYYYLGIQPARWYANCSSMHVLAPLSSTLAPHRDSGGGRGSQQSACVVRGKSGEKMSVHQSRAEISHRFDEQTQINPVKVTDCCKIT